MQKGGEGVQIACRIAYVINGRPPCVCQWTEYNLSNTTYILSVSTQHLKVRTNMSRFSGRNIFTGNTVIILGELTLVQSRCDNTAAGYGAFSDSRHTHCSVLSLVCGDNPTDTTHGTRGREGRKQSGSEKIYLRLECTGKLRPSQ